MKLGLIGYPLGHSWSPDIHGILVPESTYEKWELKEEELEGFLERRDFDGINVTIPYKEKVIPYLDSLDEKAEKIGAVNTIVNSNGKLIGKNTDYDGFKNMVIANGISLHGKKCAVLGNGGANKAVTLAIRDLGGIPITVSRRDSADTIRYDTLYKEEASFSVIVNTTPVGMFPKVEEMPIDLDRFTKLEAVIDIIANPLCTKLLFEAKCRGFKTLGGFEMLVRQAYAADVYFTGGPVEENRIRTCLSKLRNQRRNLVLIGMPTSGKSTIAKKLSEITGRPMVEMDAVIEKRLGTTIRECFDTKGESYFRDMESEVCKSLFETSGSIISTGGGVMKRKENMQWLSYNGEVLFLKRDLEKLYGTESRPLSKDNNAMKKLYEERLPYYERYANRVIDNNGSLEETIQQILEGEIKHV